MTKSQQDKFRRARAEQAVMKHVVQTKIAGTLRKEKVTSIYETMMTLRVT